MGVSLPTPRHLFSLLSRAHLLSVYIDALVLLFVVGVVCYVQPYFFTSLAFKEGNLSSLFNMSRRKPTPPPVLRTISRIQAPDFTSGISEEFIMPRPWDLW